MKTSRKTKENNFYEILVKINSLNIFFHSINYHEVIECITGALEERDLYTAGHSCRVSELVKKLSDFMGFDEE